MKTTWRGVRFIAQREAFVAVAYQDGAHMSIAFGRNDPSFKEGDEVPLERGFEMLREDIEKREPELDRMIKTWVCPHMYDALMSLGYNAGMRALRESEVMNALNAGLYAGAGDAFTRIKNHTPGLMKRRLAERSVFLEGEYGDLSRFKIWRGDPRTTAPDTMEFPEERKG